MKPVYAGAPAGASSVPIHVVFGQYVAPYRGNDNALLAKAKTGDSFGELALMADKGKRAATVRCDSYTVFLTLSKDMYERSVKSVFEQGVRERVDFLCRVATFRMLSLTKLREISLYLSKKTVEAGTIVCEQGSEPDYLYITARGSVDVEQMISGFDNTPHFSDGYEGFEPDMYTPRSSLSSNCGFSHTISAAPSIACCTNTRASA